MRKLLSLSLLSLSLSGCFMPGPMALLSPTAKYFLSQSPERHVPDSDKAISVEDLLAKARQYEPHPQKNAEGEADSSPLPLHISYGDPTLNDDALAHLAQFHTQPLTITCGPSEHGTPLEAATMALRSCAAIRQLLATRGLSVRVTFSPDAPKGLATIYPTPLMDEAENA